MFGHRGTVGPQLRRHLALVRSILTLVSALSLAGCALLAEPETAEARLEIDTAGLPQTVQVTIVNESRSAIEQRYGACDTFVEKQEAGVWQGPLPYLGPCILPLYVRTVEGGERVDFDVDVSDLSGVYRIHLLLVGESEQLLPLHMRVSAPFSLP